MVDFFFILVFCCFLFGVFGERHPDILTPILLFLLFMLYVIFVEPVLASYGFSLGQGLLLCGGILFVLIFGGIFALKMFDVAAAKKREKNQINYEANYAKQKELYLRTGKVSNWDQEGRNLFDFEVKGSLRYINPNSPPPSDRLS